MVGTLIVLLITNGLTTLNARGGVNRLALAAILLIAAMVDIRWQKNRNRIISKVYVSPTYHELPPPPSTAIGGGGPFEQNDKLQDVTLIGLERIEAPEDVILDSNDNLYAGSRHGDIIRFLAPDYEKMEVFAHIGGHAARHGVRPRRQPLRLHRRHGPLPRARPTARSRRRPTKPTAAYTSVTDDSRLRLADDLDIADDGRIFFCEATMRYEMHEWPVDGLEARGNGRIICYDPKTGTTQTVLRGLKFPNGICVASDGQSILFAETFACSVRRYWFDGPKKGKVETVIDNLPGYPDNINLASDGNYWLALVGMRSPTLDLAWQMPGFRRAWRKLVPIDEWLFPNINTGCVLKFNEKGEMLESLWDLHRRQPSDDHLDARAQRLSLSRRARATTASAATSSRRRSRLRRSTKSAGGGDRDRAFREFADRLLGRGDASIAVPSFDGALKPNQMRSRKPRSSTSCDSAEDIATDGAASIVADGARSQRLDGAVAANSSASTSRSRRSPACLTAASRSLSAGREVRSFRASAAGSQRTCSRMRGCNSVNALPPAPDGALIATDGSPTQDVGRLGARPDGTRPQRAASCARSHKRRGAGDSSPAAWPMPSAPAPADGDVAGQRELAPSRDRDRRRRQRARVVLDNLPVYPVAAVARGRRRLLAHAPSPRAPSWSNSCCASPPIAAA